MMRRWRGSIVLFACGVVVGGAMLASGAVTGGVVLFLLCSVGAAVLSPRAFPPSVTDAQARNATATDGRPIVYWRPGCPFCMRLRASLGRHATRAHWVDIWADPAGAASVREATGGDETVPTVVFQGQPHVNPNPQLVREMLQRA
ncbi:glutaredoxin domain-containing protein [Paractinoplanes rishiriensis]|uniref:glutaredoxin domain-containing protein n=1 Tax=Paractinoplanes rishiriensis TaxID=1050105 RepID=UPI001941D58B|nr:glutaredoxin domain-containing protein [Actinoplanes rishiriensis]